MSDLTTAFWGMTINNYDETDLAMVQNGYPDHMRELVYTLEEGEEGTPHIQAWFKLKRQQRLSFVKKLFPRGHFKALCSSEYQQNTKVYAQKLDGTARSPAVHQFQDPIHTIEGMMKQVMRCIHREMRYMEYTNTTLHQMRSYMEKRMVEEDYTKAKVFVSATYKQMWKQFGPAMYSCLQPTFEAEEAREKVEDTHTHTHADEKFSRGGGITSDEDGSFEDGSSCSGGEESGEDDEGDQDSEGSEDEGYSEGSDDSAGEDSDESRDGE